MSGAARSASICRCAVELPNDFFAQAVVVAKDVGGARAAAGAARDGAGRAVSQRGDARCAARARAAGGLADPVSRQRPGHDPGARHRAAACRHRRDRSRSRGMSISTGWSRRGTVRINIDQDQARLLGLSSQALAAVLNSVVTGTTVTQLRDGIYLVDVVARATDEQRVSLATLRNVQVPLPNGRTVPLSQFASFDFDQEFPLIWRRDRVPTLTVQADVAPGALPESVVATLAPAIEKLNASLPESYHIEVGGTVEESAQLAGLGARRRAADAAADDHLPDDPAAELQPAVRWCSIVVPMAMIGVVAALLIFQRPLGFVAILGILALIGMIARNAVILIEQIEAERAEGKTAVGRGDRGRASRASARSC